MRRIITWSIGLVLIMSSMVYAQMTVRDSDASILMRVYDEGSTGSVYLPSGSAPLIKDAKLYNQGGALYWDGSPLGTAGSAGGWTDVGSVVRLTTSTDKVGIGTTSPQAGLHLKGTGYPNSFMFLQGETGGSAGFRLYEGTVDKWHIFNSYTADGLHIYNHASQTALFADQSTANVGIGTTSPEFRLSVGMDGGILAKGSYGSGNTLSTTGEGARMIWYPRKAAFRAGRLYSDCGTYWDNDSIGDHSIAMGYNTRAIGAASVAMGRGTRALGNESIAVGHRASANGDHSFATGSNSTASGENSTAIGRETTASASQSTAMGHLCTASGQNSTAMGWNTTASNNEATAIGNHTTASGSFSTSMGTSTIASGENSLAIGREIEAAGDYTVAIALSDQDGLQVTQNNTLSIMGGKVGIGTTSPEFGLSVGGDGGILATTHTAPLPTLTKSGAGRRLIWYPAKSAFRAGFVNSTHWDDANIGQYSVAMGFNTKATGESSMAIGWESKALGSGSTALGYGVQAIGDYSTAIGSTVKTTGHGSLMIGDFSVWWPTVSENNDNNVFVARFDGGYRFYTEQTCTYGVKLLHYGNAWVSMSDSTKKENFKPVDGETVLNKISQFNLGTWNYIGQDPKQYRHYGPMAQDFFNAFGHDGIGIIGNDTTLASADFDGINFIAVQALEKRTSELREQVYELKARNEQMAEENETLKSQVALLLSNNNKQEAELTRMKIIVADLCVKMESNPIQMTSAQSR